MATVFFPLIRSTLLCVCCFSCFGSSRICSDVIPICVSTNCCGIRWNYDGKGENLLYISFFNSDGHPVNCSHHSSNVTLNDISTSRNPLDSLDFTRMVRSRVFFNEAKLNDKGSNNTIVIMNCTAADAKNYTNNVEASLDPCNLSDSNHTTHVICIFSFESSISTGSTAEVVLQVFNHFYLRLGYESASGEANFMKIVALLILIVLFILLLLVMIGLCMICKLKINLKSHSNLNRTLPRVSMDQASIATYASAIYPSRQILTDYHEVNILPSVSEVDEVEVFEKLDDDDSENKEKSRINDNENVTSKSSVGVAVDDKGDEESAKFATVPRVKKPSVVYAFIKKTKST